MVDESLHFNIESAFNEVLERRKAQGAYDKEAYDQFAEDVIDEKLDQGVLSDDDNLQEWKEKLQGRWHQVEQMDAEKQDGGSID